MSVFLSDPDVTLHCGDALAVLPDLDPESVDCVITSPPYADARGDYRGVALGDYRAWSASWLHLALTATRPTGSLLLNLGRIFRNGEEQDYQHEVIAAARTVGWRRLDTLVWSKPNANPIRGQIVTDSHEYVYVFGREEARLYPDTIRTEYAESTRSRFGRRWSNHIGVKNGNRPRIHTRAEPNPLGARPRSVIEVYVGREKGNPHPAPMPLELALDLVRLACPHGGTVLDPFAGSGTTARAARTLGRSSVLIEEREDYCALIADRLSQQSLLAEEAV